MSLKSIKGKIRGVDKTHKVTKAMEAVSAVKMRKSQEKALRGRPYAVVALSILERVGGSLDALSHPLLDVRPLNHLCLLVITSDKGLAGNLNNAVIRATEKNIKESGLAKDAISIVAFGRKGRDYFQKHGYPILGSTIPMNDEDEKTAPRRIVNEIIEAYRAKSYDRVIVIYNQFRSTFEQEVVVRQLLPLSVSDIKNIISGITPERGRYSHTEKERHAREVYTIEPHAEAVLDILFPYLLQVELHHSILEATASEHSARMVAMKNASDKAHDFSKELTRTLNKARQAHITREISEIVGGIEAMRV